MPRKSQPLCDLIEQRLSRRTALLGLGAASLAALPFRLRAADASSLSTLDFDEIAHGLGPDQHVSGGHTAQVLIRWGDPLFSDSPAFDPDDQAPQAQARQFGTNCDFNAFYPDPGRRNRGVLCTNNEHAFPGQMFPSYIRGRPLDTDEGAAMARVAMEAVGVSIVELERERGQWRPRLDGRNRRITATTPIALSGPVAGHQRVRTAADPEGRTVLGTFGNCAGGKTPWGTYLTCEEGIGLYFSGDPDPEHPESKAYEPYGLPWNLGLTWWADADERFDIGRHPTEPNRFGWVVEIDPGDPQSTPRKRTALGRFFHEAASVALADDGRAVVYMGDDSPFQFLYRFVTAERAADAEKETLLDDGVLHVARFDADGSLEWMPLLFGEGPLTAENGFESQADILIETRRAAALLGATPMDRPEDVEVDPASGAIFVVLTGNSRRTQAQITPANPRANNLYGHIIRIDPPKAAGGVAHGAQRFGWEIFIRCGDPEDDRVGAAYHPQTAASGWLANPDNCAFDARGRLWLATDHGMGVGHANGLWACDTEGGGRALMKHFYRCPAGGEVCGPEFADGGRTLFLAVQHPGTTGEWTARRPISRWPDFDPAMPPRPSLVVITRDDGGPIGG